MSTDLIKCSLMLIGTVNRNKNEIVMGLNVIIKSV